jgi:gamma-glutamylcyclotransferase (GGCT)/AIG2-like uncharacterized protein YtfP
MNIDIILENLNNHKNIANITLGNRQSTHPTQAEIDFSHAYRPENVLIVYGTLAPNAPNHAIVAHIKGQWHQGIVRGTLIKEGWGADLGYLGFKHNNESPEIINVHVLISDELVENWQYLDDFEGEEYRRQLVKYELHDGQIGIGNIYAINERTK